MQQQWLQVPTAPHDEKPTSGISSTTPTVPLGLMFFVGALCVVMGGVLGFCYFLFYHINPFDFLAEVYLMLFGTLMCLLDAPLQFKCLIKIKMAIGKYARILTRLTGKGVWFLFLGSTTFVTLQERMGEPWAACIFGGISTLLGLGALTLGLLKSLKWDRVRRKIMELGIDGRDELIDRHMESPHGLTKTEFWTLCTDVSGIRFDHDELSLIFNAFTSENPVSDSAAPLITYENMIEWTEEGPLVLL